MKITISGKAGSGKSSVARVIARRLKIKHYSIGDFMRQIAKERGISLSELGAIAETDKTVDEALDKKQIALKDQDDFVIDGRLTAYFIPNADLKVFLDCDDTIRAHRILKDQREGESAHDIESTLTIIKEREASERKRYSRYYGVDYYGHVLYDLIIDTSALSIDETVDMIIKALPR